MCGIVCAFDLKQKAELVRPKVLEMSKIIRHRGPDWSGIYSNDKAIMAHERLAIVDPASGKQPLFTEDKSLVLAANGEIYNHRELRKQFEGNYKFQTESDCEVILALYKEKGVHFLDEMNGIFGFAIYDVAKEITDRIKDQAMGQKILRSYGNHSLIYWLGSKRNFLCVFRIESVRRLLC